MSPGNDEVSLLDLLDESRRSRAAQSAVVDGDVRFTYGELADRVDRLVAGLSGAGVGAGDRIAWVGMNSFKVLGGRCRSLGGNSYLIRLPWPTRRTTPYPQGRRHSSVSAERAAERACGGGGWHVRGFEAEHAAGVALQDLISVAG
jgi:acyl-CoA synthetase (AMP-forming)/AMP-acid ligase II